MGEGEGEHVTKNRMLYLMSNCYFSTFKNVQQLYLNLMFPLKQHSAEKREKTEERGREGEITLTIKSHCTIYFPSTMPDIQ